MKIIAYMVTAIVLAKLTTLWEKHQEAKKADYQAFLSGYADRYPERCIGTFLAKYRKETA